MDFNPTRTTVHNEGCDLHYWYQGSGPLMIFVPGGNGHGRQFNNIIAALSDRFTCATFDRRQMSASQVPVNKPLSMTQQARDLRAVIKAMGFDKAIIFGSSSGGIIGYQFAHDFPDMVVHLISHEAGISVLMPEASEIYDWMYGLIELHKTKGLDAVAAEFDKCLIGYKDEGLPKSVSPEPENARNFWEYEFPSQLGYCPNFFRIKENKTSIGVMRGVRCKEAFYARAIEYQAEILGCPRMTVPGHHEGFQCETKEFVPALLEMLEVLEKRKESR
jgi:pimeloyl-ACP methyl ester carboxylesterase